MYEQLTKALVGLGGSYEIVFVDDGSRDGSAKALDELAATDPTVRVIHFRKNFGKSPALAAAFERVRGEIVLTLDADLQDDPALIPEFVARIKAGADLVSGWKKRRHDPFGKTFPSKLFNWMVRQVSGLPLRDFNCGFKAYRAACIRELSIYGGFHRFLPVLASERGFRVEELVVMHRARKHGVSKFGARRFLEGLIDLLTVLLVTRFRTKPAHFFGMVSLLLGASGVATLGYLSVLWILGEPIGTRPLLLLGVLLTVSAVQFIAIGLVAELMVRTTIRSREVFSVSGIVGFDDDHAPRTSAADSQVRGTLAAPAANIRDAQGSAPGAGPSSSSSSPSAASASAASSAT